MYSNKKKSLTAASLIVLLLIIDQIIKVTVKLHMNLGEAIHVFDWFQIEFVENNGMAWGMELGSKLFLSIFRIVAVGFLIWYISDRIKRGARMGYIIVLSMICAGAAGNIFDSLIYGQIFTASTPYYLPGATPSTLVSMGRRLCSYDDWERLLICSIFHCFMVPFPIGFHYGVESHSYSFHLYLTSLTLVFQ